MEEEIKEDTQVIEKENALDRAERLVERQEKANIEAKAITERNEKLAAKRMLGGDSEAGYQKPKVKPKVLTDTEYAEALQRGEVNPLKEDGVF